jgi:hypothetical protein
VRPTRSEEDSPEARDGDLALAGLALLVGAVVARGSVAIVGVTLARVYDVVLADAPLSRTVAFAATFACALILLAVLCNRAAQPGSQTF